MFVTIGIAKPKGVCGPPQNQILMILSSLYDTKKRLMRLGISGGSRQTVIYIMKKNQQNPYINYPQVVVIVFHRLVEA
jgi:hypothetical protein